MTCDEVDISWIFQPCDSSSGADDLFGGSSGISIFCLSIFWQVAFVTMSNVLYLLKASIISHILARWQAIQSHYSQQLQSHLSRSVNVQKAGSGAWWKTRSGHRWLILLLYIPDQASSSDSVKGIAKSDISSSLPGNGCPFFRYWHFYHDMRYDIVVHLQQL